MPPKRRKPTGYLVRFTIVSEVKENSWRGTGAGDEIAFSLRHLSSILKRLNRRDDMRAEVIPIWGPLAQPGLAQMPWA